MPLMHTLSSCMGSTWHSCTHFSHAWVTVVTHAPTLMYKKGVNKLIKGEIIVDEKYYCIGRDKKLFVIIFLYQYKLFSFLLFLWQEAQCLLPGFTIFFSVCSYTTRSTSQRELWGIISVLKADKDYLTRTKVIIEMNRQPILGMVSKCTTPNLAMLKWIAYIKSLNLKIQHITGKDNAITNMLSRV